MPLRQFNGYFSKYKNKSSMKPSGISKILYIPLSKVCVRCEIACHCCPHLGLSKHRDIERAVGQTTVRAITQRAVLIVSVMMRAGIRAVSAGCCADSGLDYINLHGSLVHGCVALDNNAAPHAFSGVG